MKTRIISIILFCAVIVLSLPLSSCEDKASFATDLENVNNTPVSTSTATSQFVDVPQWATEAVAFVADREIMVGVGNNFFDPQSNITKKECAATLYRIAGSPEEIPKNKHCIDLQDQSVWYYNAAIWCVYNSVIEPHEPWGPGWEAYFEADKAMTRSEIVESVYCFAYFFMKQIDSVGEFTEDGVFTRGDVGTWEEFFAYGFIDPSKEDILAGGLTSEAWRWAVKQDIIFGYEDNSLRPENPVTRAEYAAIITRFIKHFDLQFE